jgi:hypothetical protein
MLDTSRIGGGIAGSAPHNVTIDLVYIFPGGGHAQHVDYAWRFLNSYHKNPPLGDHNTVVVCNGGTPDELYELFRTMPGFRLARHDDSAWDIGAYQAVARSSAADLMLFCGGATYFRKPGWLHRVAGSVGKYGLDALYGSMGNTGDQRFNVYPHVRTTGFWIGRTLFNRYPVTITQKEQRYEFEHGATGLTTWVRKENLKAWIVGWDSEYAWPNWDQIRLGFHQGDQSNLLIGDRLSEPPYHPYP